MKVPSEKILRPGAVLKVKLIDFSDPEVKRFVERSKEIQRRLIKAKNAPFKNVVITI